MTPAALGQRLLDEIREEGLDEVLLMLAIDPHRELMV
jgi:hypothetical protein